MRLSIIDDQASSSTQPVEVLTDIFSQASLQPTAGTPRTPNKRSLVKFKQRPGPRKHPIAVGPRWVPLAAATPFRARKCRAVEFKLRVLSWAEHGRVDDGNGGQRKPTSQEVRVRFGLKQRNQVLKWKKVRCKIIRLFGKLLMEVFKERGIAASSESTHCMHTAQHPRWKEPEKHYAPHLRSGENWGVLYVASGSSVPRSGYSAIYPYSTIEFCFSDGWFSRFLHRNDIALRVITNQAQETPAQHCEMITKC